MKVQSLPASQIFPAVVSLFLHLFPPVSRAQICSLLFLVWLHVSIKSSYLYQFLIQFTAFNFKKFNKNQFFLEFFFTLLKILAIDDRLNKLKADQRSSPSKEL
jgi:hypothetical protein